MTKKVTVTKEYDIEGRLIKETTITEEFQQAYYPYYPHVVTIPSVWHENTPTHGTVTTTVYPDNGHVSTLTI